MYTEAMGCFRELIKKVPDWIYRNLIEKDLVEKLAHESGIDFDTLWHTSNSNQTVGTDGIRKMTEDEEYYEEIQEEL